MKVPPVFTATDMQRRSSDVLSAAFEHDYVIITRGGEQFALLKLSMLQNLASALDEAQPVKPVGVGERSLPGEHPFPPRWKSGN